MLKNMWGKGMRKILSLSDVQPGHIRAGVCHHGLKACFFRLHSRWQDVRILSIKFSIVNGKSCIFRTNKMSDEHPLYTKYFQNHSLLFTEICDKEEVINFIESNGLWALMTCRDPAREFF